MRSDDDLNGKQPITPNTPIDVLTIGRVGVDLYGQQLGGRLEDMTSFAKYVGGCPANIAIGAARLGLRAALLTRVGNDPFGRFIREQMQREGVLTSGIVTDPDRLTALAILGIRDQTNFPLLFYRENCADIALCEQDVREEFIESARAIVITGTHMSQPDPRMASIKAIRIAKAAGASVVFDVDYRPVLWGLTNMESGAERFVESRAATDVLQAILADCDLVVGTEEELRILGGSLDTLSALRQIRVRTSALIICKRGAEGCCAFEGAIPEDFEAGVKSEPFPVEVQNVLGAGDAFLSGFLRGWLDQMPLETCCRIGNACGALVASRHGCSPAMPTSEELELFLSRSPAGKSVATTLEIDHVHWTSTRTPLYEHLLILAMDHRSYFYKLIQQFNVEKERVGRFKALAFQALDNVARGDSSFGMLIDAEFGLETLRKSADYPYWVGRPIETPASVPVEYHPSPDVATELNSWPIRQIVKCLVIYHPDDDNALRSTQEHRLLQLFDACRKTQHELMLEIIVPQTHVVDEETLPRALNRLYDAGVFPDWWKLEPSQQPRTWERIEQTLDERDSRCRGVLVLGQGSSAEELGESFRAASHCTFTKGFAVGRTIFEEPALLWLQNKIDEAETVELLEQRISALVDSWWDCHPGTGGR